jgi:hypothetical protein
MKDENRERKVVDPLHNKIDWDNFLLFPIKSNLCCKILI